MSGIGRIKPVQPSRRTDTKREKVEQRPQADVPEEPEENASNEDDSENKHIDEQV